MLDQLIICRNRKARSLDDADKHCLHFGVDFSSISTEIHLSECPPAVVDSGCYQSMSKWITNAFILSEFTLRFNWTKWQMHSATFDALLFWPFAKLDEVQSLLGQ